MKRQQFRVCSWFGAVIFSLLFLQAEEPKNSDLDFIRY